MSTTASGTNLQFTHSRPQQLFRVLELPPDLVEVLGSDNPPKLYLKSSSRPYSSGTGSTLSSASSKSGSASDYVNLCTATKTYSLRQVNSSNSTFLIRRPIRSGGGVNGRGDEGTGDGGQVENDAVPRQRDNDKTITAIAECKSILEVLDVEEGYSALPFLLRVLTIFDVTDVEAYSVDSDTVMDEIGDDGHRLTNAAKTTMKLFADIPLSLAECTCTWVDICAFVYKSQSLDAFACCRPSAAVKLLVWKAILEGSVLQGIDLEKQFLVKDLWGSMVDEDASARAHPFPEALFQAVVRRLMDDSTSQINSELKWANLDKNRTVAWVGEVYLEATAPNPRTSITCKDFLSTWSDLLPEKWRMEASVNKLKDSSYEHPDQSAICFKPNMNHQTFENRTMTGNKKRS